MRTVKVVVRAAILVALSSIAAAATNLTLKLTGDEPITKITARYQCDRNAMALGLPAGQFAIEYVNGAGNSLAVLPIHGQSLIFANVLSASGARYAAGAYIWWEAAGRSITLSSDSLEGKKQTSCRTVAPPKAK